MNNLKQAAFVFFMFLSVANSIVFFGENSLISYLVGELIIFLFCYDLLKIKYRFHIYQILLVYFYYSLCITNSFSGFHVESSYYFNAYLVNFFHFIFFILGYNFYKYKYGLSFSKNKQSKVVLVYVIAGIFVALSSMSLNNTGVGYSSRFTISPEEVRIQLNIFDYISSNVFGYIKGIIIFLNSNPMVYAVLNIVNGFIGYISGGVKASILGPMLVCFMIYQVYYKTISVKALVFIFPFAIMGLTFLISTTVFRNQLSLESILSIDLGRMTGFLRYFLRSPESSHIIYTANVMEMLDVGETSFRYGFDYFRFILYPFKSLFDNFEFASFVQYPSILAGKPVNQGLYLGFAGELYWNFGWVFFIFSFILGLILKWFSNRAFSNKKFGVVTYLILFKTVLWIYYRGIGNELTIITVIYSIALIFSVIFINVYYKYVLQVKDVFLLYLKRAVK
jgi:hypothetical protein